MDFFSKLLESPIEVIAVIGSVLIVYKLLDFLKFLFSDVIQSVKDLSKIVSEDLGMAKELKEQRDRDYQGNLKIEEKKTVIYANLQAQIDTGIDLVKKNVNRGFKESGTHLDATWDKAHADHQTILNTLNLNKEFMLDFFDRKLEGITKEILASTERQIHELANTMNNMATYSVASLEHMTMNQLDPSQTIILADKPKDTAPLDPSHLPENNKELP